MEFRRVLFRAVGVLRPEGGPALVRVRQFAGETILTAGPPVEIDRPRRAARVADEQEARAAPEEIPAPADARIAIEIDHQVDDPVVAILVLRAAIDGDRKSTRLNSSH